MWNRSSLWVIYLGDEIGARSGFVVSRFDKKDAVSEISDWFSVRAFRFHQDESETKILLCLLRLLKIRNSNQKFNA